MKRCRGLQLVLAAVMLMTTPAFAADYNFETLSPKDFYESTSYEESYGAQYNYSGINAVDLLDPLAGIAPVSSVGGGLTVEYGITAGSGSTYPDSAVSGYPIQWGDVPTFATTLITSASEVKRSDGSVGTLVIPSLGIRYKVYEGTDSAAMQKGVGHFPSTSAWDGNIGLCGHNRGSSYNIGARYFVRELLKPLPVTARSELLAKVPEVQRRTSCTLETLRTLAEIMPQACIA